MKTINKIAGLLFLLLAWGCSSDLDFDQVNDLLLKPVVVGNLASFDVAANQFVNSGVEKPNVIAFSNVGVFNGTFLNENLVKADLFFEVNNAINRGFDLELIFIDAANRPLTQIQMMVQAYTGTPNITTKEVIFEGASLDLLTQTKEIAFVVTLLSGPPLTSASIGNLKLRSSATAYLEIQ